MPILGAHNTQRQGYKQTEQKKTVESTPYFFIDNYFCVVKHNCTIFGGAPNLTKLFSL